MVRELQTAGDVISEFGGGAKTARLLGKTDQVVSNWKRAGRLPAYTFPAISRLLEERGCKAPLSVWGIVEPDEATS